MPEMFQEKQKRARVKGQVTRIHTFLESNPNCTAAEAQILATATKLQRIIDEGKQPKDIGQQPAGTSQVPEDVGQVIPAGRRNKPKLPEIKLPEFNGEYTKWLFVKNSFETTVHNDGDLSGPQKYQYLVGVLTGEARKVMEGFSSENYEQAWQLLKNTYDNEMMIIDTHLEELFKFPVIVKDDKADSMRQLIWHIQTHMSSLKSLHQPVDHWDTIIIHLAKRKLEYTEQRDWQNCIKERTPQNMPKLEDFVKFITERCHTLRMINQAKPAKLKQSAIPDKKAKKGVVLTSTPAQCKICSGEHQAFRCDEFIKLSSEERKRASAKDCKASACRKCSGRHNTMLHKEETKKAEGDEAVVTPVVTHCSNSQKTVKNCGGGKTHTQVVLSTAQVYVRDGMGSRIRCRALLDPGSQLNLMTTDLWRKLKLPWTKEDIPISGISLVQTNASKTTQLRVESAYNDFAMVMNCLILPTITVQIPQQKIEPNEISLPRGIQLADPDYCKPGKIDLLIGAGPYWKLLIGSPENQVDGQPSLQDSKLGWILGGELRNRSNGLNCSSATCLTITNDQLSQQVERFWKIENIPESKHYTKEERECEKHFSETAHRMKNGRFVVRLPMRSNLQLGESRNQAQQRLEALERRLLRDSELAKAYYSFMEDYQRSGHMTQISEKEIEQAREVYYIPHHAVVKPDSLTTRLRVVFDASAKTTSGASLNDKLLPGPNLQRDIFKILLRFRTHQYVITADIAQMFRQILVDTRDRALQLILWKPNPREVARIYQLNTVTYGMASAPYHAMRCLQELATQH
ncbi:PREDICTED: uncharacterized protein LOC105555661 [Vollenhovia emeryi]|uniref:uncharacterized protein LOC105555661 n=1 Tax=Vollenhovia emeryi TaxID=411798 RepID=UPI0005F45D37|nr:PREDICTED: uncharacterized protein LOC105555661 [Vollenhovia emeryi]